MQNPQPPLRREIEQRPRAAILSAPQGLRVDTQQTGRVDQQVDALGHHEMLGIAGQQVQIENLPFNFGQIPGVATPTGGNHLVTIGDQCGEQVATHETRGPHQENFHDDPWRTKPA